MGYIGEIADASATDVTVTEQLSGNQGKDINWIKVDKQIAL